MANRDISTPATDEAAKREGLVVDATLQLLNEQADSMRVELSRLRRTLSAVQRQGRPEGDTQLLEANEHLILAALHSESIADAAISSLSDLARSAQRDTLTDTPNRALMLDRMQSAVALAERHGTRAAVLFLDLDGFKQINDTLGHSIGDAVLQSVARRLESIVRNTDTVARHGGDEFLVLMSEISQPADAALIAEKILGAFAVPASVSEHLIDLSVSIGIAVYPEDGEDPKALIDRADAAMYIAKQRAGSSFVFANGDLPRERLRPARSIIQQPVTHNAGASRAEQSAELLLLREANEQLVLGALASHEVQERAEIKNLQQAKFIAMVAHELRNPLTPIRNAAELLKRVRSDQTMLEKLQGVIERQVAHMTRLIDDLLDGSRAGVGKLRIHCAAVNILDALSEAIDTCSPVIKARHQQFDVHLPPGPINAQGDHLRLAQIFSNLLDNASKYTPERGRIRLALEIEGETIVVTVADNGIGIRPESLPHIFELFVQDERALTLQNGGLGIGLAVVRDLVEAHGGSVIAKSAGVDRGSEFVVRLPILRDVSRH